MGFQLMSTECEQEKHKQIIMKFSYKTEKQIGATKKKKKHIITKA